MGLLHEIRYESGASLEKLGHRVLAVYEEHLRQGHTVVSVSHAVDPSAPPNERYTAIVYIRGSATSPPAAD